MSKENNCLCLVCQVEQNPARLVEHTNSPNPLPGTCEQIVNRVLRGGWPFVTNVFQIPFEVFPFLPALYK